MKTKARRRRPRLPVARPPAPAPAIPPTNGARQLSPRELEIVRMIADGLSHQEIATHLGRALKTIETHRSNISRKLGFSKATLLVRWAMAHGIVS